MEFITKKMEDLVLVFVEMLLFLHIAINLSLKILLLFSLIRTMLVSKYLRIKKKNEFLKLWKIKIFLSEV